MDTLNEIMKKCKEETKEEHPYFDEDKDYNAQDHSGGNFSDCFENGMEAGRECLAFQILNIIYKNKDREVI